MNKNVIAGAGILLILAGVVYFSYRHTTIASAGEAIAHIKKEKPELSDYPSNNLPPKRIESKEAEEGWYLGFYMEGSGLPGILQANCFLVTRAGEIREAGMFGGEGPAMSLDPSTCTPIDDELALYFADTVTNNVIAQTEGYEKMGLGGGVTGFLIMKAYTGLVPSDFALVRAQGGNYLVQDGKLYYNGNAASNSPVITPDGMKMLLANASRRLNITVTSKAHIDRLLDSVKSEAAPASTTLTIKTWSWVEALYNDGRTIIPVKPVFTLTFSKDGTFSAKTDCNNIFGRYTANEGTIAFTNIGMTKMFCEASQEQEFLTFLQNSTSYHFAPDGKLILDLKFDSGSVVFK
jgi:heat shock protein HslJ